MKTIKYLQAVKAETKYIKWPTSKTAIYFTVGVLIIAMICAVYLYILDLSFTGLLNKFVL